MQGLCYENIESKQESINYYYNCLIEDPTYIEAFQRLIDNYLLTNNDSILIILETKLLVEIKFKNID